MAVITIAEIRSMMEGYCVDENTVSDNWITSKRDNYVIPVIINKKLGIPIDQETDKVVYIDGTGESLVTLPDKNIKELVRVRYVNSNLDFAPVLANFILISDEGQLKARYNFNESYVRPVFPKGMRNIEVTYKIGYNPDAIPADINELIGLLTIIEILTWIEGRSGGGNVKSESFSRTYGALGKYTNIRRQLTQRCNIIMRSYRSYVI